MPLIQRQVQLGDQSYQAHTYGVLSRFGTVNDLSMHGVAVGDRIALADSPVRALEAGETVDVSLMADVAYDEARWAALGGEVTVAAAIGRAYEHLGPKTMLLIPVEFPDRDGSPWSSNATRDSRISDIKDYFSTASYGTSRCQLSPIPRCKGWITAPRPTRTLVLHSLALTHCGIMQ